jgi:CHAD domain-containing protein
METKLDYFMNLTEAHASNTASIPPPKNSSELKLGNSLFAGSVTIPGPGTKIRLRSRVPQTSFSIGWHVPPAPATCLANSLKIQWKSYRKQLRECQKDFSETSVHQLRVATRRLMTYYALVGSVASGDKVAKARKKLKRHLKILGRLRDAQVQRLFIEEQMERFPFLVLVRDFLKGREQHLVKDIAKKVDHFKSRKLEQWTLNQCKELTEWSVQPGTRAVFAAHLFTAMADAFRQTAYCRQTIDPADVQTIHRTRVAFKKFRYMVEALSPHFTGLSKRGLRRLGNYQRRMGNLQDLEILQNCLARFLRENPGSEERFAPFHRYLHLLRNRALRSCLKHADDLFAFWDSARFGQSHPASLSRTAA